MLAAISPTACLSLPRTVIRLGAGTSNSMPSGAGTVTGCEYPTASSRALPFSTARYPTPTISSRFSKPLVTPSTMFAISVLVSPWSERWKPSSSGRSTRIDPSSCRIRTSSWKDCSRVPRGPFTVTREPSTATSTPLGMSMGCFPILLMSASPHVRQHFAPQALPGGVPVRHQSPRRGHDGDPQPAQHPGELVALRVHAPAGLGHAPEAGDGPLPVLPVFQLDPEHGELVVGLRAETGDVALLLQDLADRSVHLRGGDVQVVLRRKGRVPDAREQVRDGVGDVRGQPHHEDFVTPGTSPASASSRRQIRHSMNLRKTARARPHRRHRV